MFDKVLVFSMLFLKHHSQEHCFFSQKIIHVFVLSDGNMATEDIVPEDRRYGVSFTGSWEKLLDTLDGGIPPVDGSFHGKYPLYMDQT